MRWGVLVSSFVKVSRWRLRNGTFNMHRMENNNKSRAKGLFSFFPGRGKGNGISN